MLAPLCDFLDGTYGVHVDVSERVDQRGILGHAGSSAARGISMMSF